MLPAGEHSGLPDVLLDSGRAVVGFILIFCPRPALPLVLNPFGSVHFKPAP